MDSEESDDPGIWMTPPRDKATRYSCTGQILPIPPACMSSALAVICGGWLGPWFSLWSSLWSSLWFSLWKSPALPRD